jgi:phospholipid/cholesterol/gamma-HCH transport system ATP-binding protein
MADDNVLISIRDVHKTYDRKQVHSGVSLDVIRGEIMTLVGGSGEGKTILLKEIIGLIKPDKGSILVEGLDVVKMRERDLVNLRRRIGYLFQGAALFDYMNVFDNIAYPLRQRAKREPADLAQKVTQTLQKVGLRDVETLMPEELSGGMKKRVGLARAIITEPDIVLYDEPTTGLDPNTSRRILDLIKQLQRDLKITSVMVTHDMPSIRAISDRMALLWQGQIVATGTWQEMKSSENPVVTRFLQEEPS